MEETNDLLPDNILRLRHTIQSRLPLVLRDDLKRLIAECIEYGMVLGKGE